MTRKFSSISIQSTLATGVSNSALLFPVAVGTGSTLMGGVSLAGGNVDQYSIVIDANTINAEIAWVTAVSGDNLTVLRGKDGTSAITHSAGAIIQHVITAGDLAYFTAAAAPTGNLAVGGLPFPGSTSGTTTVIATAIAGTNTLTLPATNSDTLVGKATTDVLTNKTLTAPVIATIVNTGTLTLPTSTDTLVGQSTTDTLNNKTLVDPKIIRLINNQVGTSYTLVLTDASKEVIMNNASPVAFSVPTNASVPFQVGTFIRLINKGVGLTTISAVTPGTTTIISVSATPATPTLRTNGAIFLTQIATDVWEVSGDVTGAATYAAPTIGSTAIASGATVTTIAGLTLTTPVVNGATISGTISGAATISGTTKVQSTQHTQLDGNGFEMDLVLLNLAGAI